MERLEGSQPGDVEEDHRLSFVLDLIEDVRSLVFAELERDPATLLTLSFTCRFLRQHLQKKISTSFTKREFVEALGREKPELVLDVSSSLEVSDFHSLMIGIFKSGNTGVLDYLFPCKESFPDSEPLTMRKWREFSRLTKKAPLLWLFSLYYPFAMDMRQVTFLEWIANREPNVYEVFMNSVTLKRLGRQTHCNVLLEDISNNKFEVWLKAKESNYRFAFPTLISMILEYFPPGVLSKTHQYNSLGPLFLKVYQLHKLDDLKLLLELFRPLARWFSRSVNVLALRIDLLGSQDSADNSETLRKKETLTLLHEQGFAIHLFLHSLSKSFLGDVAEHLLSLTGVGVRQLRRFLHRSSIHLLQGLTFQVSPVVTLTAESALSHLLTPPALRLPYPLSSIDFPRNPDESGSDYLDRLYTCLISGDRQSSVLCYATRTLYRYTCESKLGRPRALGELLFWSFRPFIGVSAKRYLAHILERDAALRHLPTPEIKRQFSVVRKVILAKASLEVLVWFLEMGGLLPHGRILNRFMNRLYKKALTPPLASRYREIIRFIRLWNQRNVSPPNEHE